MTKLYFKQSWVCLGIGALALTACVDNDYDVSNVDATVQIGQTNGKFTLPASSTGDIELKNLFNIDDGSAVEEINGTYFINKGDKVDPSTIKIDEIKIKKPQAIQLEAKLQWNKSSVPVGVKSFIKKKQNVPDDAIFIYSIGDITKNAEITAKTDDAISKDLEQIDNIGFAPITINMDINIGGENKEIFKQIHFTDLVLNLPKGLHIYSCKFGEKDGIDFKNLLDDDDDTKAEQLKTKAKEDGIIEISKRLEELSLSSAYNPNATHPLSLELSFNAADVESVATEPNDDAAGQAYFYKQKLSNPNESGAKLLGKIELGGYAYGGSATQIDNDVNTDLVKTKAYAYITSGQITMEDITSSNWEKMIQVIVPSMEFKGAGEFNNDILVNSFTGKVQHAIDQINPIELNELPDFLTDDENTPEEEKVKLDLSNPQIFLKLDVTCNNGVPFDQVIRTGIQMDAYQDVKNSNPKTQNQTATLNTGVLEFQGKDAPQFSILKRIYSNASKSTDVSELPEDYTALKDVIQHEKVDGLSTFLNKVPNTVKVKGLNNSDKIMVEVDCKNLRLPQDVKIDFEYKVFTALSFGQKFQVVYSDTEKDMSKDFGDIEGLNFGGLEIEAKVNSDLPLPVTLDLKAVDINGNEIGADKLILPRNIDIPANANGHPITLTFKPAAGYTFNDFITGKNGVAKLDGIKYKAVLGGQGTLEGQSLKPTQKLVLKDVKISLLGGITYTEKEKDKK